MTTDIIHSDGFNNFVKWANRIKDAILIGAILILYFDNQAVKKDAAEIRSYALFDKDIVRARARIQRIVVNVTERGGQTTPEEAAELRELRKVARLDDTLNYDGTDATNK